MCACTCQHKTPKKWRKRGWNPESSPHICWNKCSPKCQDTCNKYQTKCQKLLKNVCQQNMLDYGRLWSELISGHDLLPLPILPRKVCDVFGARTVKKKEAALLFCAMVGITRIFCAMVGITWMFCAVVGITCMFCAMVGITWSKLISKTGHRIL